jgi:hypothetical protein
LITAQKNEQYLVCPENITLKTALTFSCSYVKYERKISIQNFLGLFGELPHSTSQNIQPCSHSQ